jgi:hypothetical protein
LPFLLDSLESFFLFLHIKKCSDLWLARGNIRHKYCKKTTTQDRIHVTSTEKRYSDTRTSLSRLDIKYLYKCNMLIKLCLQLVRKSKHCIDKVFKRILCLCFHHICRLRKYKSAWILATAYWMTSKTLHLSVIGHMSSITYANVLLFFSEPFQLSLQVNYVLLYHVIHVLY